jgi:hypothetical protein
MKEIDWREDGTDLMDAAESFYLNLKNSNAWGLRSNKESTYALQATAEDEDLKPSAQTEAVNALTHELRAFAAQMSERQKREEKYKWKLCPTQGWRIHYQKSTSRWRKKEISLVCSSQSLDSTLTI